MRNHLRATPGEHWIYLLAVINTVVMITLLYTVKAPINFVFW